MFLEEDIRNMDNGTLLNLLVLEVTNNTNCADLDELDSEVNQLLKKLALEDKIISYERAKELIGIEQ